MMHTYSRPVNTQVSIHLCNAVYKSPIELFGRKTVLYSQECRRLFRGIRFDFLITFTVRGRETYIQDREQRKVIRTRKVFALERRLWALVLLRYIKTDSWPTRICHVELPTNIILVGRLEQLYLKQTSPITF